jgi:hypothetical protein
LPSSVFGVLLATPFHGASIPPSVVFSSCSSGSGLVEDAAERKSAGLAAEQQVSADRQPDEDEHPTPGRSEHPDRDARFLPRPPAGCVVVVVLIVRGPGRPLPRPVGLVLVVRPSPPGPAVVVFVLGGPGGGPGYGLLPVITCCRFGDLIDSIVVVNRIVWEI